MRFSTMLLIYPANNLDHVLAYTGYVRTYAHTYVHQHKQKQQQQS